jgi:hypothetical protein
MSPPLAPVFRGAGSSRQVPSPPRLDLHEGILESFSPHVMASSPQVSSQFPVSGMQQDPHPNHIFLPPLLEQVGGPMDFPGPRSPPAPSSPRGLPGSRECHLRNPPAAVGLTSVTMALGPWARTNVPHPRLHQKATKRGERSTLCPHSTSVSELRHRQQCGIRLRHQQCAASPRSVRAGCGGDVEIARHSARWRRN